MFEIETPVYCIDANILIQAWQSYYSPQICPEYWEILNRLGKAGVIFIPEAVYEEIKKKEDDLFKWLKKSDIPIKKIDGAVTQCLKDMYRAHPKHKFLVAENGKRSAADPWVIAHAIKEKAVVVTKENKNLYGKNSKIKIPHVCENMDVRYLDDFALVKELNIQFSCSFATKFKDI